MGNKHDRLLYQFCCDQSESSSLDALSEFNDLNILSYDGSIIRTIVSNNQPRLLEAMLDYFEHKQFPVKNAEYRRAYQELMEILDEASSDSTSDIKTIVSHYTGHDIAILSDLDDIVDEDENLALQRIQEKHQEHKYIVPESSKIEECVLAAKTGDCGIIREHLDITNSKLKIFVIATAVQNSQEQVIVTLLAMVSGDKEKTNILYTAGDMYSHLNTKLAEKYYNMALDISRYDSIVFSKLGALYQHLAQEECLELSQKSGLLHQAIENYEKALAFGTESESSGNITYRLHLVEKALALLRTQTTDSPIDIKPIINELLSYFTDSDEFVEDYALIGLEDASCSE